LKHPAYGRLREVTDTASVLLADNPGLLTLEGTNTWLLSAPGSGEFVVVDPGPDDPPHVRRVVDAAGVVSLVLISHRHADHTGGIDHIVELTGAPVRAVDPEHLRGDAAPLSDGEVIEAAGLRITVLATPGHTADSVSFVLHDAVLTADTVLGRGTTVIDKTDGNLGDYLESLKRLRALGRRTVLPGHGPDLPDLQQVADMYLAHRQERLDQIRGALKALGDDATVRQIVEYVYTDVDQALWDAAEWSVQAQLDYLRA
jgi:glyoxylase-like metal-dependent hydrolase (beta-lactamase superfamily II)